MSLGSVTRDLILAYLQRIASGVLSHERMEA